MRDILGGKGAGLAEMANLGLPVPPGFTISAKLCITYLEQGTFPDDLREEVDRHLKQLERLAKKRFGDAHNPLLVSVRSGAAVSMPGMMETILNLGLNDETVQGLIAGSKNPRFAYDSYRRFVQMYGDVVFDLGKEPFTEVLDEFKRRRKAQRDIDLPADDLKALAREFKSIIQSKTGLPFPEDPTVQLWGAIAAVFKSWRTRRAVDYRRVHGIPDDLGTAVNVVAMVYGNMGDDSGTGVAFTRDCSTGEAVLNGDVLTNAQGEDVVSGARTPGAATGEAVFDADEAEALAHEGRKVILIRPETSPEDFHGIVAAQAVLTARGGMTSHAAVVARGMGKTCVVGAKDIEVDPAAGRLHANGRVVKWGQLITVDGTTGRVLLGAVKLVEPKLGSHYTKLMAWADEHRRLRVRANADTPADAKRAREFGAEGIGLCRTEHMVFEGDRITAIFEAACRVVSRGKKVTVEVMIPLVALVEELRRQTEIVCRVAREVFQAEGRAVPYLVGTMIELPRAALTADEIAKDAEFFSFGTNDLTQTTFGLSRDDAGRFLPFYVEHGILKDDPFQVLDQEGVGKLIELAVRLGRGSRGELKIGICGEHGGEPASVKFCHHVGMNYVSCSPFRVPIARLAAAQAALEEQGVINRTRATV